jgi:hypothetical protein
MESTNSLPQPNNNYINQPLSIHFQIKNQSKAEVSEVQ